mmetsp:Transcript_78579/g.199980  ORF Transcript_78579/g.199980 Transcript_78579/m.199980 type:complete len:504 (-) Transcript_78579:91-1602(-)
MSTEFDKGCDSSSERQSAELQKLWAAVDSALLAEGMAVADEPESELPSRGEALDIGLDEVQDAVAQLLQRSEDQLAEDPALKKVPALLNELIALLQRTARLAQVRGQRAQRLEADLARARAATRAEAPRRDSFETRRDSFAPAPRRDAVGRESGSENGLSVRAEGTQDLLDGAASRLTQASKTIKDKEWELVQARQKVDQLEQDRTRQDHRIRELETMLSRITCVGIGAGFEGEVARLTEKLENKEQSSPETTACESAREKPRLVGKPDAKADDEEGSEARRIRFPPSGQVGSIQEYAVYTERTCNPLPSRSPADHIVIVDAPDTVVVDTSAPSSLPASESFSTFVLDNSYVKSATKGLTYRISKDLTTKDGSNIALWGSVVRGVDEGDGWVKIGDRYLPKEVQGLPVLTSQETGPRQRNSAGDRSGHSDRRRVSLDSRTNNAVVPPLTGLAGLGTLTYSPSSSEHAPNMRANTKPASGPALPTDMRSLGKLLTGHAIKTPRR